MTPARVNSHLPLGVDTRQTEPLRIRLVHVLPLALSNAQLQGRVTVGSSRLNLRKGERRNEQGRGLRGAFGTCPPFLPLLYCCQDTIRQSNSNSFAMLLLLIRRRFPALLPISPPSNATSAIPRLRSRYRRLSRTCIISPEPLRTRPAAGRLRGGALPTSQKSPWIQPVARHIHTPIGEQQRETDKWSRTMGQGRTHHSGATVKGGRCKERRGMGSWRAAEETTRLLRGVLPSSPQQRRDNAAANERA